MQLCRCPHCGDTFQVSIPPDSRFWDRNPRDEDGMACWVCLDCHTQGLPPVQPENDREMTHTGEWRERFSGESGRTE